MGEEEGGEGGYGAVGVEEGGEVSNSGLPEVGEEAKRDGAQARLGGEDTGGGEGSKKGVEASWEGEGEGGGGVIEGG